MKFALPLVAALLALPCAAQNCPPPAEVEARHLLGFWRAEIEGAPGATLLLEKHPVYAGSLRGAIDRNGVQALVAADIDDGDLTLEESANGINIDATWLGTVEEDSCGTRIKGTRQSPKEPTRGFVLRKLPDSR